MRFCSQTRTFAYDALSRLREATNPESGTIKYTYDENGNLKTKWDARGIKTVYDYDRLNRVWKRCYKSVGTTTLGGTTCAAASGEIAEPNTPDVTYYYDNVANAKGKLTKVTNGTGVDRSTTEYTAFDILGRVTAHKQTTDGVEYTTGYIYNLGGAVIEQTYPSGRVVKNTLDAGDGSLSQVQSKRSGSNYINHANSFVYNAAGAVEKMRLGNGLWETTAFNSRMQPTQIALGLGSAATDKLKLQYEYGASAATNNGNVTKQTITIPGTMHPFIQNYTYDEVNRIASAEETQNTTQTWKQTFTYDRYGNRSFNTSGGNTTTLPASFDPNVYNPTINTANNRFSSGQGYSYDSAGNTTADAEGRTFVYDAENKQVSVTENALVVGQYVYDGDGKRVKKIGLDPAGQPEQTVFVYDASGRLIGEYSTAVQTGTNAKTTYTTNDHLGSPRINTDATGQVISRHDYHPFGEEIARSGYGSDTVRKQFTGYERDAETELDFAQARYYTNQQGRFTSPDDFTNDTHPVIPSSWNLYVYVRNNPLNLTDPSGEEIYAGNITDPKDRDEFLRRANYTYGCQSCVTIDKNGYLRVDTTGLSKTILKATQYLTDAINSKDPHQLFSVTVTNNNKDVAFGDSRAAAGSIPGVKNTVIGIRLDFADDKAVSGDSKSKEAFLNLVFAHEVGHFAPDFIQDPVGDRNKTGPVVDKVNEIQQALGLPLRAQYSAGKTGGGDVWVEVGFGKAKTDKSGQISRDGTAIRVEKQNKVVRWVRSIVGGKGIN